MKRNRGRAEVRVQGSSGFFHRETPGARAEGMLKNLPGAGAEGREDRLAGWGRGDQGLKTYLRRWGWSAGRRRPALNAKRA